MKIGVLSNVFQQHFIPEVEEDLVEIATTVMRALQNYGHETAFYDVTESTFERLRRRNFDIAFNVCERFNGNSTLEPHVPAMLELLGIKYTGSGPMALATCMNKARVKDILVAHGIKTPKYQLFFKGNDNLSKELKFPLFTKPNQMDNSIGITNDAVVRNEEQLRKRVKYLMQTFNQPVLVEEYIEGTDIDAGVLGNNDDALALPLIEVEYEELPKGIEPIFSYDAKWNKQSQIYNKTYYTYEKGDIPKRTENKIKEIAVDICKILDIRDYGRVDLRLDRNNEPYVLEMNPNPGISADCSTPFAAESLGISHDKMINLILYHAMKRYGMIKPSMSFRAAAKSINTNQVVRNKIIA